MHDVKFTEGQRTLRAMLFCVAAVAAFVGLLSPVHEFGHLIFGGLFSGGAEITSFNSTRLNDVRGLGGALGTLGGAWGSSLIWLLLWRATWKYPVRSIFAAFAIFGTFNVLLPMNWSYGLGGSDAQYVTGYWLWVFLWWGAWFGVIFRKIIREKLDKRSGRVYDYEKWQADVRRRSAQAGKNPSR